MMQIRLTAKLKQIIPQPPAATPEMYRSLGIIVGVSGLVGLGVALYLTPQLATLGLVLLGVGLPIMFLFWHRPDFGLLTLIFLTSSLVPSDVVDLRLPIGGGLELRDLLLMTLLGLLMLRSLSYQSLMIPWWPVGAPLLVFLGFAIFSALYALIYQNVESNWALSDLRSLIFYCIFFVAGWSITSRRQLAMVLIGLFILSDLLAGILILQQFLGANNPLLAAMSYGNWRVYTQETTGLGNFGTVRIMPPGIVLPYFMMIMAFCLMVFTPRKQHLYTILALQFVGLNIGLLLTYTRALWIASAIALGLVLLVLFPTYKSHLNRYLVIGISMILVLFSLLGTDLSDSVKDSAFVTASVDRMLSIFTPEETLESDSLQWRLFETEAGLRSVSKHPLLGVGLGNSYREITTLSGEAQGWLSRRNLATGVVSRFTRFLHNSYLSLAVKMGLLALASFLWFCAALVINCALLYRHQPEGQPKAIALAVMAGFVGLMLWSFFHQHFVQTEGTAVVGLMAGLVASIQYVYRSMPVSRSEHYGLPG